MSDKTITDLIYLITWDRRIVTLPDDIDSTFRHCMLMIPSVNDHNMANHTKQVVYDQAIKAGVSSEADLLDLAISAGMWSEEKNQEIDSVSDRINKLESRLLKEKTPVRRKKTIKEISDVKSRVIELENEKASICVVSADYMSHEQMVYYMVSRLVHDIDGNRMWTHEDSFDAWRRSYSSAAVYLAHSITREDMLPIENIRRVARSPEWRLLWVSSKDNIQSLFTQDIRSLNMNQKMLLYWSRVYDNAFESGERPDQDILDHDDKFDAWFQAKIEDREERKLNNGKRASLGEKSVVDHHHERGVILDGYYSEDCVCGAIDMKGGGLGESYRHSQSCSYGVFINYSEKEKEEIADQVYSRNSKSIRSHVNFEQEYVADVGAIQEQHLRNRRGRMILGSDTKASARKR